MDKYIGKLLGGRYEIIDVVGVGGMAVVYRARCHVLNRYVAVKILKDEYAKDPEIRKRFSIESQAVAKLSHHNIVSVYDVGSENGTDYIVMELIEGITLKEYLQKKGRLTWQESVFFAEQICRALIHAHSRGIIHQDIKPQNVIILRDGTAKLTDFGIASFATTQETRVVQEAIGSVHYISPEQAKGSKIDYRTDIYSLGVVMYEMLTGKLPFEGDTALQIVMQHLNTVPLVPSELIPDIPKGLDEIVMHAMCANIGRRYASAEELYADLERLRSDPARRFGYTALVDEGGETQVIGREVQQAARYAQTSAAHSRAAGQADRSAPRRTSAPAVNEPEGFFDRLAERPGLAAGMAVAVVAVITLFVVGILLMTGRSASEKIAVPSFIGMDIDAVMADAAYTENFTLREADERLQSNRPVGEVLEQDVDAGNEVVKGTVITLTVSAGGENVSNTYKVVDFADRALDYVTTILDEHGIQYVTQEEFSEEVEAGHVIRTEPGAGAELQPGASITIYVSRGREIRTTTVPRLYGMTQNGAEQALNERGLSLGSVTPVTNSAPVGTVVWQSTDPDTEVDEGTVINIQISNGPGEQTPGSETPNEQPGGGHVSEEPPAPAQGSATVQVTLPENTDIAHIVISVDGVVQYDETHETSLGSISVPLTSTAGEHEVTVSVDGNSSTQTYTFS
nr:Stk1 family PASTA domain-containing Ser/Thr kinase [uncultured Agathobaculum sp.]